MSLTRRVRAWHIPPIWLERFHLGLTVTWFAMIPVAVATRWLFSIAFVAACSIYANAVGHFSSWQAARSERKTEEQF